MATLRIGEPSPGGGLSDPHLHFPGESPHYGETGFGMGVDFFARNHSDVFYGYHEASPRTPVVRGSNHYASSLADASEAALGALRSSMEPRGGAIDGRGELGYGYGEEATTTSEWSTRSGGSTETEALSALAHITNIVRAATEGCPELLTTGTDDALNGLLGARQQLIGWLQMQSRAENSSHAQNAISTSSTPSNLNDREWSASTTEDYRDNGSLWGANSTLDSARFDSFSDSSEEVTPRQLRSIAPFSFNQPSSVPHKQPDSRTSHPLDAYGSFDTNSLMPIAKRPRLASPRTSSESSTRHEGTIASTNMMNTQTERTTNVEAPNRPNDQILPGPAYSPRYPPPVAKSAPIRVPPLKLPQPLVSEQPSAGGNAGMHDSYRPAFSSHYVSPVLPHPATYSGFENASGHEGYGGYANYVSTPHWLQQGRTAPPEFPSPYAPGVPMTYSSPYPVGAAPTASGYWPPTSGAASYGHMHSPATNRPFAPTLHSPLPHLTPLFSAQSPHTAVPSPHGVPQTPYHPAYAAARAQRAQTFQSALPTLAPFHLAGAVPPSSLYAHPPPSHAYPSQVSAPQGTFQPLTQAISARGGNTPISTSNPSDAYDPPLITKTVSKTGRPLPPVSMFKVKPSKSTPLPQVDPTAPNSQSNVKLPASLASIIAPGLMDSFDWRKPTPPTRKRASNRIASSAPEGNAKLSDFSILGVLGTGTFGKVHLCQHIPSKQYYCMKVLKKQTIYRFKQMDHIINEKQLLSQLRYPGIVQLFATFTTQDSLMLLMEYVPGGELFYYIRKFGRLSEDVARFYAAELVLTILHLHERQIVYRDLKPENILLDSSGHLKLADFGFAKRVVDKTWTMCGTPDYLAPEIITGRGHDTAVDWWSLGVLIFEMLAGYPPFTDKDMGTLFRKIQEPDRLFLPTDFSQEAADLVRRLLVVDPSRRLGNIHLDISDIQTHPWFRSIHWEQAQQRLLPGPIVPILPNPSEIALHDQQDPNSDPSTTPHAPLHIPEDVQRLFDRF